MYNNENDHFTCSSPETISRIFHHMLDSIKQFIFRSLYVGLTKWPLRSNNEIFVTNRNPKTENANGISHAIHVVFVFFIMFFNNIWYDFDSNQIVWSGFTRHEMLYESRYCESIFLITIFFLFQHFILFDQHWSKKNRFQIEQKVLVRELYCW